MTMQRPMFASTVARTDSDERFTPRWVFDGLGVTFDTDPASPIEGGDHVPAHRKLTRTDDGLACEWHGTVWLNPPFSSATAWASRFREHANGIWLGPVANSRWWIDLLRASDLVLHSRDFPFDHPTHAGKRSSMPLAFIAIGPLATNLANLARLAPIDIVPVAVRDVAARPTGAAPSAATSSTSDR